MAPKPLDMGPYMVVRAKEKGDAELLATLKAPVAGSESGNVREEQPHPHHHD
jgi:hypothetical protein